MKKEKISVTAIIFYVFAVLFLAYTAYSIFTSYQYVAGYIEQGAISYSSDFQDIIALYVQQCGPYLVYALTLYGIGYIIDIVSRIKMNMNAAPVQAVTPVEEDDAAFLASLRTPATADKKAEPKKEIKKEDKKESKKAEGKEEKKETSKPEAVKKETAKKETKTKTAKTTKAKAKKEEKPVEAAKKEEKPVEAAKKEEKPAAAETTGKQSTDQEK